MPEIFKTKLEDYLNWLAGADHSLTDQDLKEIKGFLYSEDADIINAVANEDLDKATSKQIEADKANYHLQAGV